jgi:hypothetical protein
MLCIKRRSAGWRGNQFEEIHTKRVFNQLYFFYFMEKSLSIQLTGLCGKRATCSIHTTSCKKVHKFYPLLCRKIENFLLKGTELFGNGL